MAVPATGLIASLRIGSLSRQWGSNEDIAQLLLFVAMLAMPATAATTPTIGKPLPDIELTLVDGSKVRLADLRGQVIILNFWTTWCVPCRRELPLLDAYYRTLRPHGLRVFAVTTEGSVPIGRMKALFAAMAIPAVRRVKGMPDEMPAVPTNYVIDRDGIVRYAKAGALELDDLNREIIPLVNAKTPA